MSKFNIICYPTIKKNERKKSKFAHLYKNKAIWSNIHFAIVRLSYLTRLNYKNYRFENIREYSRASIKNIFFLPS